MSHLLLLCPCIYECRWFLLAHLSSTFRFDQKYSHTLLIHHFNHHLKYLPIQECKAALPNQPYFEHTYPKSALASELWSFSGSFVYLQAAIKLTWVWCTMSFGQSLDRRMLSTRMSSMHLCSTISVPTTSKTPKCCYCIQGTVLFSTQDHFVGQLLHAHKAKALSTLLHIFRSFTTAS